MSHFFVEPPFNYTGSKFKILHQIIPLFDKSKSVFVDSFAGGGSVWSNVCDLYENVVINDVLENLVEIQKLLIFEKDKTLEIIRHECSKITDKESYFLFRKDYNKTPNPYKFYALLQTCFSNLMRFNQKFEFNQTYGKRNFNKNTLLKIEAWCEHLYSHKDKLAFNSEKFDVFLERMLGNNDTFFYFDPPYSFTEAGYNAYWNETDDRKLLKFVDKINETRNSFALSNVIINDIPSPLIENLMSKYKTICIDISYKKVQNIDKKTQEILIVNY